MKSLKQLYINRNVLISSAFGAVITLASCTDYDDHFDASSQILPTASQTIWQNIAERQELSQFKSLVERSGMATHLNEVNSYTVWAPKNGTFDYDSISQLTDSLVLARFVKNHVANFSHSISGADSTRIQMLNNKKKVFMGSDGNYTIAGITLTEPNIASSNGFLHVIDDVIPYRASIYESLNNEYFPIDSVSDYIHKYDVRTLNLSASTEGPTVNGERTYLDSVFIEYNSYLNRGPYINEEDSNYTMLVPTNEAWQNARNAIKKYYNFLPSLKYLDNSTTDSERSLNTKETTVLDASYLLDSVATRFLMSNLFLNNNLYDNGKLQQLQTGGLLDADSLVLNNYSKIFRDDATELMKGVTRYETSNGLMFITDSIRFRPWFWNPPIQVEAEWATVSSTDGVMTYNVERVGEGQQNPVVDGIVSGRAFRTITASANKNPKIDFRLPNLRSTEYNVYVVLLPNNITNIYDTIPMPNKLMLTIGNNDEQGNLDVWRWKKGEPFHITNTTNMDASRNDGDYFSNDPTKVDTIYVGTFNFPIAYANYPTSASINPFLRLQSMVSSRETSTYKRDIRLDCIILVPTELDTFMREHPGYYDHPTLGPANIPLRPEE